MTIIEKNNLDSPWLFRTQPLQTGTTQSTREIALHLAQPPTPVSFATASHQTNTQQKPLPPSQQQQQKHTSSIQITPVQPQRIQQNQVVRTRPPIDPKKVVKSSTAPNLPTSNSLSEMFRVI